MLAAAVLLLLQSSSSMSCFAKRRLVRCEACWYPLAGYSVNVNARLLSANVERKTVAVTAIDASRDDSNVLMVMSILFVRQNLHCF
jgi:hypothetical protein